MCVYNVHSYNACGLRGRYPPKCRHLRSIIHWERCYVFGSVYNNIRTFVGPESRRNRTLRLQTSARWIATMWHATRETEHRTPFESRMRKRWRSRNRNRLVSDRELEGNPLPMLAYATALCLELANRSSSFPSSCSLRGYVKFVHLHVKFPYRVDLI